MPLVTNSHSLVATDMALSIVKLRNSGSSQKTVPSSNGKRLNLNLNVHAIKIHANNFVWKPTVMKNIKTEATAFWPI